MIGSELQCRISRYKEQLDSKGNPITSYTMNECRIIAKDAKADILNTKGLDGELIQEAVNNLTTAIENATEYIRQQKETEAIYLMPIIRKIDYALLIFLK